MVEGTFTKIVKENIVLHLKRLSTKIRIRNRNTTSNKKDKQAKPKKKIGV